jgi:RNA polymerase sigma-70 factor, ECF subfamily
VATVEEDEAIEAMRRGDIGGLETVVRLHQTRALRMALALTGNRAAAEDVVSDAFVLAFERIAKLKPGRPFEPWLRGIVRHLIRRSHRASARLVTGEAADATFATLRTPPASDPAEVVENTERRQALLAALSQIPLAQREVLVLRYYLDLDVKAVADELKLNLNTVKSHSRRGLHQLRVALGSRELISELFSVQMLLAGPRQTFSRRVEL